MKLGKSTTNEEWDALVDEIISMIGSRHKMCNCGNSMLYRYKGKFYDLSRPLTKEWDSDDMDLAVFKDKENVKSYIITSSEELFQIMEEESTKK